MTRLASALVSIEEAARTGLLLCTGPRGMEYIHPRALDETRLQHLRSFEDVLSAYQPEIPAGTQPLPTDGRLPVSDIQRRQILTFKSGIRADPYIASAGYFMNAPLLPEGAARAASELEARHGALQYDIEEDEDGFWHVKRAMAGVALRTFDLSQTADEALPAALRDATSWLVDQGNNLGREAHCRLAIVAISGGTLIVALAIDHLFSDLHSVRLVLSDFLSLYGRHMGHPVPLKALQPSYGEHLRRMGDVDASYRKFWSLYLAGASQPAFCRKRTAEAISYETRLSESWIGAENYTRMKAMARQAKGTLFAAALAKAFVLVRSITGQSDVTLGLAYDNRDMSNSTIAGLLVDTIFVRAQAAEQLDADYISYVWASARAALRHAKAPRSHVIAGTGLTHPPVLINFMGAPAQRGSRGGRPAAKFPPPAPTVSIARRILDQVLRDNSRTMPQLLYIMLNDSGHDLQVRIYYNPQYFDEQECSTMHRIFGAA
jgi:hypothetical protein